MKKHYLLISQILFFILTLKIFAFEPRFVLRIPLTYVLLAFLGLRWLWYKLDCPGQEVLHHGKIPLIIIFVAMMSFGLYGPLLQAKWGPIDDHEIMNYLGQNGKLTLTELPFFVSQSEAVKPGVTLRYRPIYQLLRLGESAVWGNHPQMWYLARLLILIASLSIFWYLISPLVGFTGGGIFSVYLLAFDYWKDIWARLGPSETYAVLGLALFALALTHLWQKKLLILKTERLWWLIYLLGALLCIGSKENFVFLIFPNIFLGIRLFQLRRLNLWRGLALAGVLGFAIFVFAAVWVATAKVGHDVYDQSVSVGGGLNLLITGLKVQQSKYFIVMTVVLSSFWVYLRWFAHDQKMTGKTFQYLCILAGLWALFIFHFIFYHGNLPSHSRYDFPGMLFVPLFYVAFFWYFVWLIKAVRLPPVVRQGMQAGLLTGIVMMTIMKGFVGTQVAVATTVQNTQIFTSRIEQIAQKLRQDPTAALVIESGNVWDYEPIYSNQIFLRAHKVANPVFLRINGYSPQTFDPGLERGLAQTLVNLSEQGNSNFQPLNVLSQYQEHCYSLRLSGTAATLCPEL